MDTKLIYVSATYNTMVNRNSTKLPITWFSKVPKRYECKFITDDLHQSKRISINFADTVKHMKIVFLQAHYTLRFVNSFIGNFQFFENKPFILMYTAICGKNAKQFKNFIKEFHHFTNGNYCISINWIRRKIKCGESICYIGNLMGRT